MISKNLCKICGSSSIEKLFLSIDTHGRHVSSSKKTFKVSECNKCKVVFLADIKINDNYYKKYYEGGYYEEEQGGSLINYLLRQFRHFSYSRKQKLMISSVNKKQITILDIGCGGGDFLDSLDSKTFKKFGLEINKEGQELSRQKGIRTFKEELPKLKIKEKFDVVTLWHVLEHVVDQKELLNHIRNILHKQGVLIIQTPNSKSKGFKLGRKDWFHLDSPRHLYLHCPESLELLAKETNFKVRKIVNECYDYPLDLFWSVRNHRYKLFLYVFYIFNKYLSREHLTYILEKK